MITLYDLAGKNLLIGSYSPNPWKVRYTLGFKNLEFNVMRLEFPDIEDELKKVGVPPSGVQPNGSPRYTCPSLTDDSTDTRITDSYKIAEYLDKAYPNTPQVIPSGTEALQAAFYHQFNELTSPLWVIVASKLLDQVNPKSTEYVIRRMLEITGKSAFADIFPSSEERVELVNKTKAGLDTIDSFYQKSAGPFLMGDKVTFADFVVVSTIRSWRIVLGEESEEWKTIVSWNNGRWEDLLAKLEIYASTK